MRYVNSYYYHTPDYLNRGNHGNRYDRHGDRYHSNSDRDSYNLHPHGYDYSLLHILRHDHY